MADDQFIGYIDIPNIHDATIQNVHHVGDKLSVVLESCEQQIFRIEFEGVESIASNRPEGMMLYSLSEMSAPAPLRHFVFTNWDENDDAFLKVLARGLKIIDNVIAPR